jgi:small subunit ribosomal protein S6
MKNYELTYIISPNMTAEEAQTKAKELESIIQSKEGVILKSEKPVAKTLSYQIKKFGSGFFSVLEFQIEPAAMTDIKSLLEKDKQFLRHIILVINPAKKQKERRQRIKPQAIVSAIAEEVKEDIEKVSNFVKEEIIEPLTEKIESITTEKEEKKPAIKKVKSEKNKEKAEMEDIDKKLDEILSE